ncbi:MAG: 3-deoxy-manno-octulosonate cytidylyltransferase [Clostridium sp.]
MKKIIAFIPARYASSRFPGKPLAIINGKPMIQWVYEEVLKVEDISEAYVATDDTRITECVEGFGGKYILTSDKHKSGSDRIAECITKIEMNDDDIVLNIQGDEPMIKTEMIKTLISAFEDASVYMATLKKEIKEKEEIDNPNIAKVITDINNDAIYFSRSTIPFDRDGLNNMKYFKHIGVYGYKKKFIEEFTRLENRNLENMEQLEQLRVIENGYKIRVIETEHQSIGVDLPEHIKIIEQNL